MKNDKRIAVNVRKLTKIPLQSYFFIETCYPNLNVRIISLFLAYVKKHEF